MARAAGFVPEGTERGKFLIDGARVDAKPIDQLSFERFQGLRDTVNQLWTLSRRTRQMEVDGQLQDMERLREALGERLDEIGLPVDPPGPRRARSFAPLRRNPGPLPRTPQR